jgi:hypothetical protein
MNAPGVMVYQFNGLRLITQYNAAQASLGEGSNVEATYGVNTLLTAHAALQALVSESAACMYPKLYADRTGFRLIGLIRKYDCFLATDGRPNEKIPDEISEICSRRIALTHSEPDSERSTNVGAAVSATDAERFYKAVVDVALWLWNGRRPMPVSYDFELNNVIVVAK